MENVKNIPLPEVFSKGFINDRADTKIPYRMAQSLRNLRIYNKVSAPRKGYATKLNLGTATPIKGIGVHNNKIGFTYNGRIHLSNEAVTLSTDLGALNTGTYTKAFGPAITSYGDYMMIFNGGIPQVRDGATLANITTIPATYYPIMGDIFSNSRWISNGTATVIRSKPAISAFPGNIYIFDDATESILKTFESPVVSIKSTINSMFVFTDANIREFSNAYEGTTTPPAPIFKKIYDGVGPRSQNSVTSANNTIFFLTKENKIKTINYVPGIPNSQVGELSNIEGNSIRQFIDETLHADQSLATCHRFDLDGLVKFNVRSKTASQNDLVLIYDMKNQTWLLDTNKTFGTNGVSMGGKSYIGSNATGKLYQDEVGKTDDGAAITCKRKTKIFDFGDPTIRKVLREMKISGSINLTTSIELKAEVDGEVVKTEYLDKYLVSNAQFGVKTVNVPYQFRKVFSRGDLYEKGYLFSFEFTATGTELDFTLENINVGVGAIGTGTQNELFEK